MRESLIHLLIALAAAVAIAMGVPVKSARGIVPVVVLK